MCNKISLSLKKTSQTKVTETQKHTLFFTLWRCSMKSEMVALRSVNRCYYHLKNNS